MDTKNMLKVIKCSGGLKINDADIYLKFTKEILL